MVIKRGTAIGNASPIRKSFVAFQLAKVVCGPMVCAFEKRLPAKLGNQLSFQLGQFMSKSIFALPQGKFDLADEFYEFPIVAKLNEEFLDFDSVGTYADYLNDGDEDAVESIEWLTCLAEIIEKRFIEVELPSLCAPVMAAAFTTGEGYDAVFKEMAKSLRKAEKEQKLIGLVYDIMSDYHDLYVESFGELYGDKIQSEGSVTERIYEMLPLCLTDEAVFASVINAVYPVFMATGVRIDLEKLCECRIARGRVFLTKSAVLESDELISESLAVKINESPEKLQPMLPPVLQQFLRDHFASCKTLADFLVDNIWIAGEICTLPYGLLDIMMQILADDA